MNKTPLVPLTAALLLATSCGEVPDDQSTEEQVGDITAAASPTPGFIESVSYTGTGCQGKTATTGLSQDKEAATSIFSAFVTPVDPAGKTVSRNCLMTANINVPRGWSYSLESVDYRGFVSLPRGVAGSRQSVYVISGSPVHGTPAVRFTGAISDDYTQEEVGPRAPGPWSPCGGGKVLRIATQIEVHGRGTGQLTIDAVDTELQWRRCR